MSQHLIFFTFVPTEIIPRYEFDNHLFPTKFVTNFHLIFKVPLICVFVSADFGVIAYWTRGFWYNRSRLLIGGELALDLVVATASPRGMPQMLQLPA